MNHPLPIAFTFAGFTFPRYVGMLPTGNFAKRLARKRNPICGPYYHAPKPIRGYDACQSVSFYLDSDFAPGLRWQWCDTIAESIGHRGWHTDDDGSGETIRGLVMRLPHGRGFLAGWSMGESMASMVECEIYETDIRAAHVADRLAETAAEQEREYQAREREGAS